MLPVILVFVALPSAVLAVVAERFRSKRDPGTLPFGWGLYQGISSIILGSWIVVAGIASDSGRSSLVGLALLAIVYVGGGAFVLKRRKWAWVIVTVASLNPAWWIINSIYGKHRWSEFEREAGERRMDSAPSSPRGTSASQYNKPPATAGAALYAVATQRPVSPEFVDAARVSPLTVAQLTLELYALRVHAAHYGIYSAFEFAPGHMNQTLADFYSMVENEPEQMMSGTDLTAFVSERRNTYAGAMAILINNDALAMLPSDALSLSFTGQPPHDVGLMFAFHCKALNTPLVPLCGAFEFSSTLEGTRAFFSA